MRKYVCKIINYLKGSNRCKHLVGGCIVGLCAMCAWTAAYAALVAASALELKDRLYGQKWDWADWTLTVVGGCASALFWLIV